MRKAWVIRHVSFEDLGILADSLQKHDYEYRYVDAGREALPVTELETANLLIVLGGPISANDDNSYPFLKSLREIIRLRIERHAATLGICLGAQQIARALGAEVYANPEKEIGWSMLELTADGKQSCLRHLENTPVLHWHGETFALPEQSRHLASTRLCENQAFQLGHHTLALQFHPEPTASGLESWYIGHTLELTQAGIDINKLREESEQNTAKLAPVAQHCFGEWLQQLSE